MVAQRNIFDNLFRNEYRIKPAFSLLASHTLIDAAWFLCVLYIHFISNNNTKSLFGQKQNKKVQHTHTQTRPYAKFQV